MLMEGSSLTDLDEIIAPAQIIPKVGYVSGYMPFFEELMPADFRTQKLREAKANFEKSVGHERSFFSGLITDEKKGLETAAKLKAFDPDVIVLAPTMAAPAGYQWAAIADLPDVPVVIWNAHELDTIPANYDSLSIIPHSGNVGCMMIGNILRRHGRPFKVLTSLHDDQQATDDLKAMIKTAAAAKALKTARLGVLGKPLSGYINVTCDPERLKQAVGTRLVDISAAEFTQAFKDVSQSQTRDLMECLIATYRVEDKASEQFEQSCRLSLALAALVEKYDLSGGTFNCRGLYSIQNPEIGLIGCLANSLLTTQGYPFTCTGDVLTAVAMKIGKSLSGNSYYCELDTIDYQKDMVLCANTGEGDFTQSSDCKSCSIRLSGTTSGRTTQGCSVTYPMGRGPATALAFTPRPDARGGHMIIAARGSAHGTPDTQLALPSLYFKFDKFNAPTGISRWIETGATHHAGISHGDIAAQVELMGHFLDVGTEIL